MDDREWQWVNVPLPAFGPTGFEQGMAGIRRNFWLRRRVELTLGSWWGPAL